jgi:hypothetical protein
MKINQKITQFADQLGRNEGRCGYRPKQAFALVLSLAGELQCA